MYLNNKKRALIAGHIMILVYVLMLCIQVSTQRHTEYFPFYSRSLFSNPVGDQPLRKSYLKVEEIDGRTLADDEGVYTVGTSGARLEKAIVALKRVPLAPKRNNLVLVLHSIPVFGFLLRKAFPANYPAEETANSEPVIVYDGDCPLCSNYVAYMKLRMAIGPVKLVDTRSEGKRIVGEIKKRGLSLDDGIVLIYEDRYYHAADAMRMITRLSEARGLAAALNHLFFSNSTISRIVYPMLRAVRNITLKLLGRRKLA